MGKEAAQSQEGEKEGNAGSVRKSVQRRACTPNKGRVSFRFLNPFQFEKRCAQGGLSGIGLTKELQVATPSAHGPLTAAPLEH